MVPAFAGARDGAKKGAGGPPGPDLRVAKSHNFFATIVAKELSGERSGRGAGSGGSLRFFAWGEGSFGHPFEAADRLLERLGGLFSKKRTKNLKGRIFAPILWGQVKLPHQ